MMNTNPIRTSVVVVPTCERDKWFSDLAVAGIRKYWPEATIVELLDTDKSTEIDCPKDIRVMCRCLPYLRKQIDAPFLFDGVDDIYILDADCFMFERPTELIEAYSYQGLTMRGHPDYEWGINVWRRMGYNFAGITPLFCAGMFKAPRTMWTYNKELMYWYLRTCAQMGYHKKSWEFAGVTLDQSLAAGLWRMTCKDNPLPALEYPLGVPSVPMKIFHACYYKRRPEFKQFLVDYKKRLDE